MDRSSRMIIDFFKKNPDERLYYSDEPHLKFGLSEDEFHRAAHYLYEKNLVRYRLDSYGTDIGISATHQLIHKNAVMWDNFFDWLLHCYAGGVVIGVSSTLLAELLIYLCAKALGFL